MGEEQGMKAGSHSLSLHPPPPSHTNEYCHIAHEGEDTALRRLSTSVTGGGRREGKKGGREEGREKEEGREEGREKGRREEE